MADCVFCGIVAGELPSHRVGESELSLAFRSIAPAAPVHVLVVPKRHLDSAASVVASDGEVLADMVVLAQRAAQVEGVAESGYRLVFNVGEDAELEVHHLHLHVIGGRKLGWPPG